MKKPWTFPDLSGSRGFTVFMATNSNMIGSIPDNAFGPVLQAASTSALLTHLGAGNLPSSLSGSSIKCLCLDNMNLEGGIKLLGLMSRSGSR
ncbi:hypothetical protein QJS10_CPB04g01218 [Acorus calamus]|uniref:Uncharacterized protein n=1 Tax=Acorus calamus TaxID=4465 RepID=A0AAV9F2F6_ACOCL|nr:hypothetical protein QJS10_CPB04g01218 [Acorus calamus]